MSATLVLLGLLHIAMAIAFVLVFVMLVCFSEAPIAGKQTAMRSGDRSRHPTAVAADPPAAMVLRSGNK